MSIERGDFEAITRTDLEELVNAQVPEGLRIEFKREMYGRHDNATKELLKDVSSFANSHGGHLLLGIGESDGAAAELPGVECPNVDSEILRMEQIVHSGIEPSIPGIRVRAIPLDSNRSIFILRIPRSWRPPHRIIAKGVNRFYVRHSAGAHEPGIEELRALFTQSSSALEHARQFRDERIAAVCSDADTEPPSGGGRLFLHLVPVAAFSGMTGLDLKAVHAQHGKFRPPDTMGCLLGSTMRVSSTRETRTSTRKYFGRDLWRRCWDGLYGRVNMDNPLSRAKA